MARRPNDSSVIRLRRLPRDVTVLADLTRLMAEAAGEILSHESPERFLAWIQEHGPKDFAELFSQAGDESGQRALATSLGMAVWNTTPLPRNGFRPDPLPEPSAEEACPCQSGASFGSCCRGLSSFPGLEVDQMWLYVVEQLSDEQLWEVGRSATLAPATLDLAARRLISLGAPRRALRLLAPYFSNPKSLVAEHEHLLDPLLDAYTEIEEGMRRTAMERLSTMLVAPLSGALAMRRACLHADAEEWPAAWFCFAQAQQEAPQRPLLAVVELILLLKQGRTAQAALRSRFWMASLRRKLPPGGSTVGDFLDRVAEDPAGTRSYYIGPGEPDPCQGTLALMLRLD